MPTIDAKVAAGIAFDYLKEVISNIRDPQLEEIELTEDGSYWRVTFSFERSSKPELPALLGGNQREYKVISLTSDTGEPRSIKIRKIS